MGRSSVHDVWLVVESEHPHVSVGNFILDCVEKETTSDQIVEFVTDHPDSRFDFIYVVGDPENGSAINSFLIEILRDYKIDFLCG